MNRKTIYSSQLLKQPSDKEEEDALDMDEINIKTCGVSERENERVCCMGNMENIKVTFGFYCICFFQ